MQGRRRPDETPTEDLRAGDYAQIRGTWWVCLPSGQLGRLSGGESGWAVEEHEDRTVTVTPSIHDAPDGWHGWLEAGVWRSC